LKRDDAEGDGVAIGIVVVEARGSDTKLCCGSGSKWEKI